jgi:hypothetical protein
VTTIVGLLQEYQRTAWEAAATDLTDQQWDATRLRGRVIDLLERAGRVLAFVEGSDASTWSTITWTEADPPVVLARALGIVHQGLAAAAAASREDDVLVTMPTLRPPRSRPRPRRRARWIVHSLRSGVQVPYRARHQVVPSTADLEADTLTRSSHRTQQRSTAC